MTAPVTRMQITLDAEQTARLLEWAGKGTQMEFDADCEPSGYILEIAIGSFPPHAEAQGIAGRIDLGEVDVKLLDAEANR